MQGLYKAKYLNLSPDALKIIYRQPEQRCVQYQHKFCHRVIVYTKKLYYSN